MKQRFKMVVFVAMMVTILISSKRIADYIVSSYEKGIAYLAQTTTEVKYFVMY